MTRSLVLALGLVASACSVRQQCAATCGGCCELDGRCRPGTDAYACGGGGAKIDCRACLVGEQCEDGGCTGLTSDAQLQLTGTNAFVPKSGQAFLYADRQTGFVLLSDLSRATCRDPGLPPNVEEQVLVISMPHPMVPAFELLSFSDGGVRRTQLTGQDTLDVNGRRIGGHINIDVTLPLEGDVDVPVCGVLR